MNNQKQPLFLLSAIDYKDQDLIVNLLSKDMGILSAVIYGGKKIGRANSFPYQPGDLLEIEFIKNENREFIRIQNTLTIKGIPADRITYSRFLFHSYLLELISKVSRPDHPAEELFELLLLNLELDWEAGGAAKFVAWSLWKIIQQGGYEIDFNRCGKCERSTWQMLGRDQRPQFRKETYRLMDDTGTLLCSTCHKGKVSKIAITAPEIKVLWYFNQFPEFTDQVNPIPAEILHNLTLFLNEYLLESFTIKPRSKELFLSGINSM